jgi:3-oxoacyl-[acyl-carrier protein] reductase
VSIEVPSLDAKVALVTGSSSGAGAEIAMELARRGARMAVHWRRALADAEAVAARIATTGGTAAVFAADLADPDVPAALAA